jgi:hypothetical protein
MKDGRVQLVTAVSIKEAYHDSLLKVLLFDLFFFGLNGLGGVDGGDAPECRQHKSISLYPDQSRTGIGGTRLTCCPWGQPYP